MESGFSFAPSVLALISTTTFPLARKYSVGGQAAYWFLFARNEYF